MAVKEIYTLKNTYGVIKEHHLTNNYDNCHMSEHSMFKELWKKLHEETDKYGELMFESKDSAIHYVLNIVEKYLTSNETGLIDEDGFDVYYTLMKLVSDEKTGNILFVIDVLEDTHICGLNEKETLKNNYIIVGNVQIDLEKKNLFVC